MEIYRSLLYTLLSASAPCTGGMLCQVAGVSPKTLRKNIREINELLEREKQARIVSKVGVGYTVEYEDETAYAALRAQIVDSYLYSQFYSSSQRNRLHFISRKLLLLEKVRLEELGEEMFYSDMTLLRDMKLVKKHLADFRIALSQNAADGYTIHGDEWDIRMALIYERAIYNKNTVLQKHPDTLFEKMFSGAEPLETEALLELVMEELDKTYRFSLESLYILVGWIQLSFTRAGRRPRMNFLRSENETTLQNRHRPCAVRIYGRICEKTGLTCHPDDVLGLCILMEAWQEERPNLEKPVRLFDERELAGYLERYFPGAFRHEAMDREQRLFFRALEKKLERILYCRRHRIHYSKDEVHHIQSTGLLCWQICSCIAQYIKETSGFMLTAQEIAHFYFVAAAYVHTHPLKSRATRVLIISSLEQEHLALLSEGVSRDIQLHGMELTSVPYTESRTMDLTGYDYIITDHLGDLPRRAPNVPLVSIRFRNSRFYPSYYVGRYKLKEYLFRQLLKPAYFFKENVRTKAEAFALLRTKLGAVLGLPRQYFEEIEQQEALLTFERANRLAVIQPYTLCDVPDFVCFIACRRPFRWQKREVQYIFVTSFFRRPELYESIVDRALRGLLHDANRLAQPWEELTYDALLEALLMDIP